VHFAWDYLDSPFSEGDLGVRSRRSVAGSELQDERKGRSGKKVALMTLTVAAAVHSPKGGIQPPGAGDVK
jgi:hypothetical protein